MYSAFSPSGDVCVCVCVCARARVCEREIVGLNPCSLRQQDLSKLQTKFITSVASELGVNKWDVALLLQYYRFASYATSRGIT
jgi:hypothetical protein